jgi:hypothetical protein
VITYLILVFNHLFTIFDRFSDRDLMMRFRGGGVGHKSTRKATDFFKSDRDRLDRKTVTTAQVVEEDSDDDEERYVSVAENIEDEGEDYDYSQGNTDSGGENEMEDEELESDSEMFGYADL